MRFSLVALLLLLPLPLLAGLVYYKDEQGNIHAASSLDEIPARYRSRTKSTAGRGPDTTKLLLKLTRQGNSLLVPVRAGGLDVTMILDTGASITLMPARIADGLNLPTVRRTTFHSASGEGEARIVVIPEFSVEHMTVKNFEVAVYDMPSSPYGLLGLDFLNHFKTTLDGKSGTLELERK